MCPELTRRDARIYLIVARFGDPLTLSFRPVVSSGLSRMIISSRVVSHNSTASSRLHLLPFSPPRHSFSLYFFFFFVHPFLTDDG